MGGNNSDRVRFGPFEANLATHELWKFGIRVKLVGQPFEVLAILLSKPGELITREELRNRLWPGDTFVDFNHGLNAAVNKLRDALSDSADSPRYVETLPRRGYRFIFAVEPEVPEQPVAPPPPPVGTPVAGAVNQTEVPKKQPSPVSAKPDRIRLFYSIATGGAALVLLLVAMMAVKNVRSHGEPEAMASSVQRIRPLINLGDPTSEPAFSSDGNYLAFRRESPRPGETGIFIKRVDSDQLWQITGNSADCCPVWSPDGQSIAFTRYSNREFGIYVAPFERDQHASGNGTMHFLNPAEKERKLLTDGVVVKRGELAWSPDGKSIAFGGGAGIYLSTLAGSTVRRLTEPPPLAEDWGPAFSPDGGKVAFVRGTETGLPGEIMSVPVAGGEPTRVAAEQARILSPPQWSADGRAIIFSSDRGSHPGMWRVSESLREPPVQINDNGWYPATSRRGYRFAYQRIARGLNIWELNLTTPAEEGHILVPSTSETDQGPGPQISPDGKKLTYMSDRSGTMEIWVSDRDGKNPFQLTAVGAAGTPRWSPDSGSIAFDAPGRNGSSIYVVSLNGGAPRMLISSDSGNVCPSWSGDGRWIYFSSHRSGDWQVWRIQSQGGTPLQLTTQGGHAPLESPDGRYVYYAKSPYADPEIWQVPVQGGMEKLLSPLVRPATWASWAVVDKGIVFAGPSGAGKPLIGYFDFSTRHFTNVGALDVVPFWLGASRDGKAVVFDQPGWQQAQIMMVENFR